MDPIKHLKFEWRQDRPGTFETVDTPKVDCQIVSYTDFRMVRKTKVMGQIEGAFRKVANALDSTLASLEACPEIALCAKGRGELVAATRRAQHTLERLKPDNTVDQNRFVELCHKLTGQSKLLNPQLDKAVTTSSRRR